MTEGQLRSKRDEFWDTAPAFEGRKEIWDALKAAAVALEASDHELAQAIVDGASITLPHGTTQHTHIYTHTRTHIYTHTHTHTRTHSSLPSSTSHPSEIKSFQDLIITIMES